MHVTIGEYVATVNVHWENDIYQSWCNVGIHTINKAPNTERLDKHSSMHR